MKRILKVILVIAATIGFIVLLGRLFKISTESKKSSSDASDVIALENDNTGETSSQSQDIEILGMELRTKDIENYNLVQYLKDGSLKVIKENLKLDPNVLDISNTNVYFYDKANGLEYIDLSNQGYEIEKVDNFNSKYSNLDSLIYVLNNNIIFQNNNNLISYNLDDGIENIIKTNIAWNGYYLDKNNNKIYYINNDELCVSDLNGENEKMLSSNIHLTDKNTWLGILNNTISLECYGQNRTDEKQKKLVVYDIDNDSTNEIEDVYSVSRCGDKVAYISYDSSSNKSSINCISNMKKLNDVQDIYDAKYNENGISFGNSFENYERISLIWYDKSNDIIVSIDDGNGISSNGNNIIKSISLKDKTEKEYKDGEYVQTIIYK